MQLNLQGRLPFVTLQITHGGASLEIDNVLVDTGSASTVLSADLLAGLGIAPNPSDRLRALRGIGGRELVFTRKIDRLSVGDAHLTDFEIEVGGMDYGFAIHGILGMDFLLGTGAVLDLRALTISTT